MVQTLLDEVSDQPLSQTNPGCNHQNCWYVEWVETPVYLTNSLANDHESRVQNSQVIVVQQEGKPVSKTPTMRVQRQIKRKWLPLPDVGEGRNVYSLEKLVCVPFKVSAVDMQKISLLSEYAQITEQDIYLHAIERWYARLTTTPIHHEPAPALTKEEEQLINHLTN
jgi:hypothetical protein